MSKHRHPRKHDRQDPESTLPYMLAQAEAEMRDGYIEVELDGLTFRRLLCIYTAVVREGWQRTMHSMRSLVRVHPAH
jgi:hypothetical protein